MQKSSKSTAICGADAVGPFGGVGESSMAGCPVWLGGAGGRPRSSLELASGMGVEASCATSVAEFASQFGSAMKNRGPRLIEVVL